MTAVRVIAFYLPQFHPIPENDAWWGPGFTEWRNVVRARPRFPGHYQPHLPADLGFYDLRVPEARQAQAELASRYGIAGFCYYHYWFHGRRLLERPFLDVLRSGEPRFPFCLCWANESWTRTWDGAGEQLLVPQTYSAADDRAHIESLIPALCDERYLRVDGRPLLLVYRTERLPDPARTADIWRETAARAGLGDLYLARVESFRGDVDPRRIGFDAAVEFAPDWAELGRARFRWLRHPLLRRAPLVPRGYVDNYVFSYVHLARRMQAKASRPWPWFRTVAPSFDNSPRRACGAVILTGSTPAAYEAWLRHAVRETVQRAPHHLRLVFVNAWNEWGEGNHLEPDLRWGRAYLEATRRAVASAAPDAPAGSDRDSAREARAPAPVGRP